MNKHDRDLGMDRPITRRDFVNGAAVAAGASVAASAFGPLLPAALAADGAPQDQPGYYPPSLTGMRGSHPGSFEAAHKLRDGTLKVPPPGSGPEEEYDLVIVGGGISGLSAAYFYRRARPNARILILDNHDDFGGHAKRNEFHLGGHLNLLNGGTLEIDSPRPYSVVSDGLLRDLGVRPDALEEACAKPDVYKKLGLKRGIFFDKETFGADYLAVGGRDGPWDRLLAKAPLTDVVKRDIARIYTDKTTDYLPGLDSDAKKAKLARISYRDYLVNVIKADPGVVPLFPGDDSRRMGCRHRRRRRARSVAVRISGFRRIEARAGRRSAHGLHRCRLCDGCAAGPGDRERHLCRTAGRIQGRLLHVPLPGR